MKKILFFLLAIFTFVACDKKEDNVKEVIITNGKTEQTIYADQTSVNNGEGIKFTTTGAWRAEVEEVTKAVSWITLDQTSGDKAGDYTLKIAIDQNTTGQSRKATVKIICGETVITITVEQKGTTEGGSVPVHERLITKIESVDVTEEDIKGDRSAEFYYDNIGRVNKIILKESEINEGVTQIWLSTCLLTYTDNTVSYNVSGTLDGVKDDDVMHSAVITLDNNGRAISGVDRDNTYTLMYDADGYLKKSEFVNKVGDGQLNIRESKVTWANGNMDFVLWAGNYIDKATYGSVLNKTNIDLNWTMGGLADLEGFAFLCCDPSNIFTSLGYMGKRCKNLVELLSKERPEMKSRDVRKYEYTIDNDGYPISIKSYYRYHSEPNGPWVKSEEFKITYNK